MIDIPGEVLYFDGSAWLTETAVEEVIRWRKESVTPIDLEEFNERMQGMIVDLPEWMTEYEAIGQRAVITDRCDGNEYPASLVDLYDPLNKVRIIMHPSEIPGIEEE